MHPIPLADLDRIIADCLRVSLGCISPSQRLVEDLGCRSMDLYRLSQVLGLPANEILDATLDRWHTVADIHYTMSRRASESSLL